MPEPIATTDEHDQRIELLEERVHVDKRVVTLGRVLVETKVETKQQVVEALLQEEEVSVQRVAIGQVVEEAPQIREENGVLVVPVVEEQLVVQVRLVLKEELRISKTTVSETVRQAIPVRSEYATVTRVDEPDLAPPIHSGGNDQ